MVIILPMIVSGIFVLVGAGFLTFHFYFKRYGKRLPGKIIGIEKYISYNTDHGKSCSTMYRPIVEYYFGGEKVWFAGGGQNTIPYKINQKVSVLSLSKGPEYCKLDNSMALIFGLVFGGFGIGVLAILWHEHTNWATRLAPLIVDLLIVFFGIHQLKKKKLFKGVKEGLYKVTQLETKETLKDRKVIWDPKHLDFIDNKHTKMGLVVSTIFFLIILGMFSFFWSKAPFELHDLVFECLKQGCDIERFKAFKDNGLSLGVGISAIFLLLATYSLLFGLRKMRRP